MARPNVTIRVADESIVVPTAESLSPTNGALISREGLRSLGVNAGETAAGLFFVETLNDWYGRLRSYAASTLTGLTGATYQGEIGISAAAFVSPTAGGQQKPWYKEWWAVHNFLQYGGGCLVGYTSDSYTNAQDSLKATFFPFDVAFMGDTADADYTAIVDLINAKSITDTAIIGVLGASGASPLTAEKYAGTNSQYFMHVYGSKVHLNALGQNGTFVTTNLTPDVAGCIVRTDRDFKPWFSPAGRVRGRIINLVRLLKNPTPAEQDALYDANINPVVSFPGEGTVLFGDRTGESITSTLSGVNVSRLFMYLRKVMAPVARTILFEQNDDITRARFRLAADGILRNVLAQRGILDYKVICDSSNNPPELIQAKVFVADILVKPTTSINFIRLTFTNKNLTDTLYPGQRAI